MTSSALLELLAEVERGALTPEAAAAAAGNAAVRGPGTCAGGPSPQPAHRAAGGGVCGGQDGGADGGDLRSLAADGVDVLATRVEPATAQAVLAAHPAASHNAVARTVALRQSAGAGCRRRDTSQ